MSAIAKYAASAFGSMKTSNATGSVRSRRCAVCHTALPAVEGWEVGTTPQSKCHAGDITCSAEGASRHPLSKSAAPEAVSEPRRDPFMSSIPSVWIWLGIALCVAQSAAFSGLNLAVFSLSQLRLQLDADAGNADAARVLELRKDSNRVLSTIIWGNVSTNVLLTLLSDSVLAGVYAFLFSAVVITLLGEIFPQAYFSRNALRMTSRFLPFLNFYLFALYPLTKPTAMVLDARLGKEGITSLA